MEASSDEHLGSRTVTEVDAGIALYLLADEFAMSSADALEVCDRVGVHAESGAAVLSSIDAERFRLAARQDAASAPVGPAWAVAGPATTAPATAQGPGWAVPAGPSWAVTGQASPPPHPGPFTPSPPTATPAVPWATAPSSAIGYGNGSANLDIDPELWGRLQRARAAANRAMMRGLGLIALGIAITLGTFLVAPGGFFIVSFGPVIAGFSQIGKAQRYRSEVVRVERALKVGTGHRPARG